MTNIYNDWAKIPINQDNIETRIQVSEPEGSPEFWTGIFLGMGGKLNDDPNLESVSYGNNGTSNLLKALSERGGVAFSFDPPGMGKSKGSFTMQNYYEAAKWMVTEFFPGNFHDAQGLAGVGHSLGAFPLTQVAGEGHFNALAYINPFMGAREVVDRYARISENIDLLPIFDKIWESKYQKYLMRGLMTMVNLTMDFVPFVKNRDRNYSFGYIFNHLFHLQIADADDAGRIAEEVFSVGVMEEAINQKIKVPGIVNIARDDRFVYWKLDNELEAEYKNRWQQVGSNLQVISNEGDHVYSKDYEIFASPEFSHIMDNTADLFKAVYQ